jgi:RND family efflux transporter MFP subunit
MRASLLRNTRRGRAAFVLVLGTLALLSANCGRKTQPGEVTRGGVGAASSARVATVELAVEPVVEQVSGTVASARHTTVSSKILARIDDVKVRAGSEVAVGDVLVVLDSRDLEARVREAQDARAAASSRLELAKSERDRAEKLFSQGVAPRHDVDRVLSAFKVASAELERAEQRLRDAEVGLSHAELRSPVAGRVVDRLAEPGDNAAPGVPLLRIYDPTVLRLEAPVRESLAHRLSVGQHLFVYIEVTSERLDGEVEEIVPEAETGARTFLVKVRFPPHAGLLSGMFGRLEVPAGERERLRIPAAAVERIGQLEFVTMMGEGKRQERRLVTTGTRDDAGNIEVLSGLAAGERVRVEAEADSAAEPNRKDRESSSFRGP